MPETKPREKPILMNGQMVRATLEGRKTQTRRPVKPQPPEDIDRLHGGELRKRAPYRIENDDLQVVGYGFEDDEGNHYKPEYVPGDRLYVRETILQPLASSLMPCGEYESYWTGSRKDIRYAADGAVPEFTQPETYNSPWRAKRPSIHMPKWAARIWLEVTDVRVERVQDITEADAIAEGMERQLVEDGSDYGIELIHAVDEFSKLWDSLYKSKGLGWSDNPWVWVYEFKRLEVDHA